MKRLIISLQFILLIFHCHGLRLPWQQQTFEAFLRNDNSNSRRFPMRPQVVITNLPQNQAKELSSSSSSAVPATALHSFRLKSIYHHASDNGPIPGLFRKLDILSASPENRNSQDETFEIRTKLGDTYRPTYPEAVYNLYKYDPVKRQRNQYTITAMDDPDEATIDFDWAPGSLPDVKHRATVLALAMMTSNAYSPANNDTDWYDIGAPWNLNTSFGWETDGIRGHVFGNDDGSILVISLKGTSAGLWGGGQTGEKDKMNDNTLFSCCCAYISRAWTTVCECYQGNEYVCENKCLQDSITNSGLYYDHAMEIYKQVADDYPNSTVWLTGHSLGGALASLVSQTFLVPTVTFEIPGEQLAARRLHLPHAPGVEVPLWNFGHTADPIFVGVCTGPASSCWYGGFAMETRCHSGKICVWDTVNEKNWRVDVRSHRVHDVIENILKQPEGEFPLPDCVHEDPSCADCGLWNYIDERDNHPSSSTTTPSMTKTSAVPEPPGDPWRTGSSTTSAEQEE
ncbi:Alpha/Beta hydrolase protein [Zychaea mexicana]|uniref:Alpha/Beta hydrolase protein n=1 Tax=Zychaea mexicana TaxID=64656 RepID=UPI0022FEE63E|nr:Alpha/Beta hydrolase protein [Zychaea mexicana]KAI9493480.1 Alpha/Beta hydrolase protein [Zychaea mexicana]